MTVPQGDFVVINGPTVTVYEPDWLRQARYSSQIVYSIQLVNGLVVTSPEAFASFGADPSSTDVNAEVPRSSTLERGTNRVEVKRAVLQLNRDEIVTRIERAATDRLKLSARDLIRAYRAGELQDPGAVADLLALAALLKDDDPLFVDP
jgi:hypothetical protein